MLNKLSKLVAAFFLCTQPGLAENRIEHIEIYTLPGKQDFFGEVRVNLGNVMDLITNQNQKPAQITQTTESRTARRGARFYNAVIHIICDEEELNFTAPINLKGPQAIDTYVRTAGGNGSVWIGSNQRTASFDCQPNTDRFDHFMIETAAPVDRIAAISGDRQFGFRKQQSGWYLSDEVRTDQVAQAQARLNQLGYDVGTPDNVMGPQTRAGIADYQKKYYPPATGKLDALTSKALGVKQFKGWPKFVSPPGQNPYLPNAAALGGYYSAFSLVYLGADSNSKNQNGSTALPYVATSLHLNAVKQLIEKGADVNFHDDNNPLPLVTAAGAGRVDIVQYLIKKGAMPNLTRKDGRTALGVAAHNGHNDVVRLLLKNGADINAVNSNQQTALILAAAGGHEYVGRTLLEAGANPKATDDVGRNAAIYAAGTVSADFFRELIETGLDVNHQASDGATALWSAVQHERIEAVFEAIGLGADPDLSAERGQTPLMIAALLGHEEIVRVLLNQEADPALISDDGLTALDMAATEPISKLLGLALAPKKHYDLADFEPMAHALQQIKPDQALLDFAATTLNKAANNVGGFYPAFESTLDMDISICFGDWGGSDQPPVYLAFRDFITNHVAYEREFLRLNIPPPVWKR